MEDNLTCKTCEATLTSESKYCSNCGARIINNRITFKGIWHDFVVSTFSWDNRFFHTIKYLILRPGVVLHEFLAGARMKYSNPFGFLAICTAIGLLVFNAFADEFIARQSTVNTVQYELIEQIQRSTLEKRGVENIDEQVEEHRLEQMELADKLHKGVLQYFNLFLFLLLPLYSFIAFKVFGRPHNYGEHLVINAYIQGLMMLSAVLMFALQLLTGLPTMAFGFLLGVVYYLYAYGKLYRHKAEDVLVSFLRFIAVVVVMAVVIMVGAFLAGILIGLLRAKFGA